MPAEVICVLIASTRSGITFCNAYRNAVHSSTVLTAPCWYYQVQNLHGMHQIGFLDQFVPKQWASSSQFGHTAIALVQINTLFSSKWGRHKKCRNKGSMLVMTNRSGFRLGIRKQKQVFARIKQEHWNISQKQFQAVLCMYNIYLSSKFNQIC